MKNTQTKTETLYNRYGGWPKVKGQKTGFFHLENLKGRWWLIDPEGNGFISKGVCNLSFKGDQIWQGERLPYHEAVIKRYGSRERWLKETVKRLKNWGFNSLGAWCYEQELRQRFPYTEILNIARGLEGEKIWITGGFPDVFAESFEKAADKICQKTCLAQKDNPFLIGYFTDNELRWQPDWRSKESLLISYLKLPKTTAGYKKAQEFLKSQRKNTTSITSKDESKFLRIVAKRYFEVCYKAIRRYDKNHLILGCRFSELPQESDQWYKPTPKEVLEEMRPFVDVLSLNLYFLIETKKDKEEFQSLIKNYAKISAKPVLISEFSFHGADSGYPTDWPEDENEYPKPGILEVQVADQKKRGVAIKNYLRALLEIPEVIGYHWFQYVDYPYEGRVYDGVAGNFGLVKIDDVPWKDAARVFRKINFMAERIHSELKIPRPSDKTGKTSGWFKIKLFKSLPKKLKLQINKLWDEYFGSGAVKSQEELLEKEDKYCSTPYAYLLAMENSSVIGVVALYKRKIFYKGKKIILGGFGGVCTIKEKRRRDVATALLKRGMEELRSFGCDVAYLCGDPKFYSRVGFVPLGKPYTYLGRSGKRYTDEDGLTAPVRSKNKFDLIIKSKEILDIGVGNW